MFCGRGCVTALAVIGARVALQSPAWVGPGANSCCAQGTVAKAIVAKAIVAKGLKGSGGSR